MGWAWTAGKFREHLIAALQPLFIFFTDRDMHKAHPRAPFSARVFRGTAGLHPSIRPWWVLSCGLTRGWTWSALCLALPLAAAPALAADSWFTFIGDPFDPRADTVQIEAASVAPIAAGRSVAVRANLAQESRDIPAPEGLPYRSFTALLHIDCAQGTARVRRAAFFSGPLWTGAERLADYEDNMPPLALRTQAKSDTVARLVLAGCGFASVKAR